MQTNHDSSLDDVIRRSLADASRCSLADASGCDHNPTCKRGLGAQRRRRPRQRRSAFTILELLVAGTLLIALISTIIPLAVRADRVWQDARAYRLAVNELSNQLEELTLLDDDARQQTIDAWKPSEDLVQVLPDAKLQGELIDDKDGKRLRLSIQWKRIGDPPPVAMVAWIHPQTK